MIWNDPVLSLPWPVTQEDAVLSEKDAKLPGWFTARNWFGG